MTSQQQNDMNKVPGEGVAWYKQFWPWFIIALPASAVIASFTTLWIAISNPDGLVVTDDEYQRVYSELKAQAPAGDKQEDINKPESQPD